MVECCGTAVSAASRLQRHRASLECGNHAREGLRPSRRVLVQKSSAYIAPGSYDLPVLRKVELPETCGSLGLLGS